MNEYASYTPFILQDRSIIALQATNGCLVSRINYGGVNGINHLEVAKSRMDVFCHFTVYVFEDGKIALQAENGQFICAVEEKVNFVPSLKSRSAASHEEEQLCWIMTEPRPLEQATRFLPLKVGQENIAFQVDNDLYLGYDTSYKRDTRLPLFLTTPQTGSKTHHTSFALRILSEPQGKEPDIKLKRAKDTSPLRLIEPFRSANLWFDEENFNDTRFAQGNKLPVIVSTFLVRAGDIIDGIQALYNEKSIPQAPVHGNIDGYNTEVTLEPGDTWSEISGFYGDWFGGKYVLQLTFSTRQGRVYGPFGSMNYAQNMLPFRLVIEPDEHIIALAGVVSFGDNGKNRHLGALGLVLSKNVSFNTDKNI